MTLEALGFDPGWADAFARSDFSDHYPARVTRVDRGVVTARSIAEGDERVAVPKRLRFNEHSPVVGDWIALQASDHGPYLAGVVTRRTCVARGAAGRRVRRQVLAANVDTSFIVTSMDADFSERRLERYLTVVHDGGSQPVFLLTKVGLAEDPASFARRAASVAPGVDIHSVDVIAGICADAPTRYLGKGRTAVFIGSSGVGKSTLVNSLAGRPLMATHEVRESDGQGQHTTVHRELFVLPDDGGVLIDTPGLRELAVSAMPSAVDRVFSDIEALAQKCRFRDCAHVHGHESNCAVQEAIAAGRLDPDRLGAYRELAGEAATSRKQMAEGERREHDRIANKRNRH
ncbi:MAG: ribosome small subunit-dependent GTPase A [Nannocystaceae bacterium]|nr:ribosome small subunit-dependent GTPase A [Nannocystaceae bacterium]